MTRTRLATSPAESGTASYGSSLRADSYAEEQECPLLRIIGSLLLGTLAECKQRLREQMFAASISALTCSCQYNTCYHFTKISDVIIAGPKTNLMTTALPISVTTYNPPYHCNDGLSLSGSPVEFGLQFSAAPIFDITMLNCANSLL